MRMRPVITFSVCAALAVFAAAFAPSRVFAEKIVRVGIYENKPKVFTGEDGKPAGFFVELVEEIAKREGWTIRFERCEWADCLKRLEDGRIDLMPDVAYSIERDERFDFHKKPVAESWSRVYTNSSKSIAMMSDLNGRKVALLEGSIQQRALEQMAGGFGYDVRVVPARSMEEAFRMAEDGRADAALTNKFFGDYFHREYGLVKTTIIFDVVALHFATGQGRNADILEAIDNWLGRWLREPDSPYYKSLSVWMEKPAEKALPAYVLYAAIAGGAVILFATAVIFVLRRQIAAQKRLQAELRVSREKYKGIFDESVAAIFVFDAENRFVDANRAGLELLRYTIEELTRMSMEDVSCDGAALPSGGSVRNIPLALKKKTGETVFVLCNSSVIAAPSGSAAGTLSAMIDVTELRNMEEEKKRIEQQLLQSQKMEAIGRLAGGVAHDFNNIVATISGTTEMLLKSAKPGSPEWEKLKRIHKSCMRAKDLSMKLLTFARKEKLNVRIARPEEIVNEVADMLESVAPSKISVVVEADETAKTVNVDANQIVQAVLNICLNGCDAMPDGGKLVLKTRGELVDEETASSRGVAAGEFSVISVEDSGEGIDEPILDRLFEPFFTTKERGKGSGLGLSVAHGIVVAHGGFIKVRASRGEGAAFSVYLPAANGKIESQETEQAEPFQRKGCGFALIIDDDEEYVQMISEALGFSGFEVASALSGPEAVSFFRSNFRSVNVVLLDMLLPEMGGKKIFAELKQIDPAAKIVICSGYSVEGDASEMLGNGALDYIQKPFDISKIVSVVMNAIDGTKEC